MTVFAELYFKAEKAFETEMKIMVLALSELYAFTGQVRTPAQLYFAGKQYCMINCSENAVVRETLLHK